MRLLAIVIARCVSERQREADAGGDHPEEVEFHDLHQEENEPDGGCGVGPCPEDSRVRFANTGCFSCFHSLLCLHISDQSRSLLIFPCIVAFINIDLIAKLINIAIPAQVDQKSPSDVLDRPEIECRENDDNDESEDFFVQERVQKDEGDYRRALEKYVEEASDWVQRIGE